MECPNCNKEIKIPNRAYLNLESYNVGGSILVATECCQSAVTLKMNVSYSILPYVGEQKEDGWGIEFKNN